MKLNLGRTLLPAAFLLLVVAVAAGAGFATAPRDEGGALEPEQPAASGSALRGTVTAATADALTIRTEAGERSVTLTSGTPIEVVRRIDLSSVQAGDWLNLGSQRHGQTMFTIVGLTVIPADRVETP